MRETPEHVAVPIHSFIRSTFVDAAIRERFVEVVFDARSERAGGRCF
jgi:hypothetical protein